jgi:hypothetical protein
LIIISTDYVMFAVQMKALKLREIWWSGRQDKNKMLSSLTNLQIIPLVVFVPFIIPSKGLWVLLECMYCSGINKDKNGFIT